MASNLEVVVRVRDLTTRGLARIEQSISRMGISLLRWSTALTGVGGLFSIAGIAKFSSELEDLEGRLAGVFEGDLKAGADQLERIRALASEPIVGTQELVDTFIKGATAIRGFSEETLDVLADVAITFNRDVASVYQAWAAGTTKSLQQLGIVLDKNGKEWTVNGQAVERNMDAVRAKIIEVWEQKFPNAVDLASQRFSGATAIFRDALEDLLAEIGGKILPKITVELNKITAWVHDNEDQIVAFAERAGNGFLDAADGITSFAKAIKDHENEWRIFEVIAGSMLALSGKTLTFRIVGGALVFDALKATKERIDAQSQGFSQSNISGEDAAALLGLPPLSSAPGAAFSRALPPRPTIPPPPAGLAPEERAADTTTKKLKAVGVEVAKLGSQFDALKIDIEAAFMAAPVEDFSYSIGRAFEVARDQVAITNQDLQNFADSTIADIKTAFTDDFAQGIADLRNGVRSFEDSWKGAVTSVLEGLQQIILKMLLMAAYQRFIAPLLGGFLGGATGATTGAVAAGALTAPASMTGAQQVVIAPQVNFNAGFVDPTGADEFFARNAGKFQQLATGAVTQAIDRSPAFRARVRR